MPEISDLVGSGQVKLLMHSIAFGSTTNFFEPTPVRQRQMDMTQHVMAHCLIYWTQALLEKKFLTNGSRIVGLTSEGSYKAMEGYGPVGVAKASLEAVVRQIGWELGKQGITANTIQAGITPTRALTKISEDWEKWVETTKERNPMKRVTTPEDVAGLVSLLMSDKADFVNCSTIFCDGGEHRSL
jgi:enoyl-[acyl-carrier-protein] reductase (NADH)